MDLMKSVKIALALKSKNQKWLAYEMGMSPANLSNRLNYRGAPSIDLLPKIAKALDMKPSELIALGE